MGGFKGGINQAGSSGSFSYTVQTGFGNKPVHYVSFWDAARFANWLTTGDTETGVYELGGVTHPDNSTISRNATEWNGGGVAVASQDEWVKAAYYDPTLNSGSGGYWSYPTQSNSVPTATTPNGTNPNSANHSNAAGGLTEVGGYLLANSYYGTFDQGGNAEEWTDQSAFADSRVMRGGASNSPGSTMIFGAKKNLIATAEASSAGFRVSSLTTIPEPSTYAAILGLSVILAALLRRNSCHSRRLEQPR